MTTPHVLADEIVTSELDDDNDTEILAPIPDAIASLIAEQFDRRMVVIATIDKKGAAAVTEWFNSVSTFRMARVQKVLDGLENRLATAYADQPQFHPDDKETDEPPVQKSKLYRLNTLIELLTSDLEELAGSLDQPVNFDQTTTSLAGVSRMEGRIISLRQLHAELLCTATDAEEPAEDATPAVSQTDRAIGMEMIREAARKLHLITHVPDIYARVPVSDEDLVNLRYKISEMPNIESALSAAIAKME
jgi:hypothetical protein